MIIQCTKKVLDKLGIKDADKAPDVIGNNYYLIFAMKRSYAA